MNADTTIGIERLQEKKRLGQKITRMAVYDYPSALMADRMGVDILLVGDSLSVIALGYTNRSEVTVDELIQHGAAVMRGAATSLVIGDLPSLETMNDLVGAQRLAERYANGTGIEA